MAYQTGRWWSGNAWTSKRFSKRWELFGNVWKCLFLIVGDQHCLRSTFVCLKLRRPILCEASQGWWRAFSVFLRACWHKKGGKKRKCEAKIGFKPTCTAPLQLLFMKPTLASKRLSKTDSSFGWLASHKTGLESFTQTNVGFSFSFFPPFLCQQARKKPENARHQPWLASHKISLQSFRQTNVDLRQCCWSPTMRKRHFQTFPNSSHLLLNLFDVHAFPLHHLPVWYAIFVWTKPYINIDPVLNAFKSLIH